MYRVVIERKPGSAVVSRRVERIYNVFLSNDHYDENWLVYARNKVEARKKVWSAHRADKECVSNVRWYSSEGWTNPQRFRTAQIDALNKMMKDPEEETYWRETVEGLSPAERRRLDRGKAVLYDAGT